MDHDMCYDVGINRSNCDEAMSNSLREVNDSGASLGWYGHAAELYMDLVGNDAERRNLKQLLNDRGKTLAHLHSWKDLEMFTNKNGGGKLTRKQRAARAAIAGPARLVVQNLPGKGGFTVSENTKGVSVVRRRRNRGGGKGKKQRSYLKRNRRGLKRRGAGINYENLVKSWRIDRMRGKRGENGIVLTGCDLIDSISIRNTSGAGVIGSNNPGSILSNYNGGAPAGWLLNPLNFTNSRQKNFAQLFQKFRYRKIRFHFCSTQTEFLAGGYLHYTDYDPDASYAASNATLNALEYASTHSNKVTEKLSKSTTNIFRPKDPEAAFWIKNDGSTLRTFTQGQYFWMIADPASTLLGSITPPFFIGRVYMEYEIEFWEDAFGEGSDTDDPAPVGGEYVGWFIAGAVRPIAGIGASSTADPFAVIAATIANNFSSSFTTLPNIGNLNSDIANSYINYTGGVGTALIQLEGMTTGHVYKLTFSLMMQNIAGTMAFTNRLRVVTFNLTNVTLLTDNSNTMSNEQYQVVTGNGTVMVNGYLRFTAGSNIGSISWSGASWSNPTYSGGDGVHTTIGGSIEIIDEDPGDGKRKRRCKLAEMVKKDVPFIKIMQQLRHMCHNPACEVCQGFREMQGKMRLADVPSPNHDDVHTRAVTEFHSSALMALGEAGKRAIIGAHEHKGKQCDSQSDGLLGSDSTSSDEEDRILVRLLDRHRCKEEKRKAKKRQHEADHGRKEHDRHHEKWSTEIEHLAHSVDEKVREERHKLAILEEEAEQIKKYKHRSCGDLKPGDFHHIGDANPLP